MKIVCLEETEWDNESKESLTGSSRHDVGDATLNSCHLRRFIRLQAGGWVIDGTLVYGCMSYVQGLGLRICATVCLIGSTSVLGCSYDDG
jgi:hypothetical protein